MSIESTIGDFYLAVEQAGKSLQSHTNEIDSKQSAIKKLVESVQTEDESKFTANSEIDDLCQKQIFQYNKSIAAWQKIVGRYVDGKEFVNKFERSLLLIVFADVKAGKSSLGNFVSGYVFKDTPYGKLYSKPTLYAYDHTDKSLKCGKETELPEGYFKEDAVQATASIQYFTLKNGLTWVDTPGIHSLTEEYEVLAKDYVKFADLILFLTPSNNPWKQDEAAEVELLVNSGKPMLFAITKSDSITRKAKDGKLVSVLEPKSAENRAAQENYVRESVSKLKRDDIVNQDEYISISTMLAKTALAESNEEMFNQSNFPKFFEQIGAVISEKAVNLKMQRPRSELNFVIDELIKGSEKAGFAGIAALIENLNGVTEQINAHQKKLSALKSEILANVRNVIGNDMYTMLSRKKGDALNDSNEISAEVDKIVSENLAKEIARTVGREISDLNVELAKTDITIDAKFEKLTQTVEYQVYDAGNHLRDPRGLIEHLAAFLFDKEFYEYSVKTKTLTKEIELGDNFSEYADSVWSTVQGAAEQQVEKELARINSEYFGQLGERISAISDKIIRVRDELLSLKY